MEDRNKNLKAISSFSILKRMVKVVAIILGVCLLIMIVTPFVAVPIIVNRHMDYKGNTTMDYPLQDIYYASEYGLDETQMYLETEDAIKVWCSEIYTEQPSAVIIYLTGIEQPSITYFYGHAAYVKENNYASILLEVRGHGQSDGNQICLGYKETKDVQAVVDYIKGEPKYDGVPIILQGSSMGGAIAINSFGQIEDIDALIAISPYSSVEDEVMDLAKQYYVPKLIQKIEKPLVNLALKMVFGTYTVDEIKPIEQIKNDGGRPILLIACSADSSVPETNTQRLKNVNHNAQIWIRDSWEHFIIKNCDFKNVSEDEEYWNKIMSFLESSTND